MKPQFPARGALNKTLENDSAPLPLRLCGAGAGIMKRALQFFANALLAWLIITLISCASCSYDPITPAHRPHAPRPNPYGLTNPPAATMDQFRATPPAPSPLLPERLIQPAAARSRQAPPVRRISTAGWEFMPIAHENIALLKQVPFVITNNTIRWKSLGRSRVIVSDNNTNYWEDSFTDVFRTNTASVPIPTNKYFRLVSP